MLRHLAWLVLVAAVPPVGAELTFEMTPIEFPVRAGVDDGWPAAAIL